MFCFAFCPSTYLFLNAIRTSGDDIGARVFVYIVVSMSALTSFFTLPSTARQQPTWCCACVRAAHINSGISKSARKIGKEREKERTSGSAVSVCSFLSFTRSFVAGDVCFLRGHTGLFQCAAQWVGSLSPSVCSAHPPALSCTVRLCCGHHLSLLLLFCCCCCCCCLCFELQRQSGCRLLAQLVVGRRVYTVVWLSFRSLARDYLANPKQKQKKTCFTAAIMSVSNIPSVIVSCSLSFFLSLTLFFWSAYVFVMFILIERNLNSLKI